MSTTNHATSVTTRSGIQIVGSIVDEQALQPRRVYLKKRAPKSPYVHDLRRQMHHGKRNPGQQRLSIAFADIDDGIPVSLVCAAFLSEIALIEEYAAARDERRGGPSADAPLLPLVQRENRFQAEQDAAERELIANPDSIDACNRVLEANARYQAENARMIAAVRARCAQLLMRAPETTKPAGRDVPDGPLSTTETPRYDISHVRGSGKEGR